MSEIKVGDTIKIIGMRRDVFKKQTMKVLKIRKSRLNKASDLIFFVNPYNNDDVIEEFRYNLEKVKQID